jgi:hypothetical protein
MIPRGDWRIVLWSALLWAVLGPLLSALCWGTGTMLSGHTPGAPGAQALLAIWPVFAPGAAISGALCGWLLIRASRRIPTLAALRVRGVAWGAGFGLLGFLLGLVILEVLTRGEGPERGWKEFGWALLTVPAERPEVLGFYAAAVLPGAVLGWIVAGLTTRQ